MAMIYGHRWVSSFGERDDGTWRDGLSGVSPQQIAHALGRCVTSKEPWPPSLPAFRALCYVSPAEIGLPDALGAWMIASSSSNPSRRLIGERQTLADRWQHPVIYHTARDPRIDCFNLRQASGDVVMRTWGPVYQEYVDRAVRGESFDFPEERAIEDRTQKAVTPQERQAANQRAKDAIRRLRATLWPRKSVNRWQQVHGMAAYV
jgi:hypothetical protein